MRNYLFSVLSVFCLVSSGLVIDAQQSVYVLEGQDALLECRIPRPLSKGANVYWLGPVVGRTIQDNYAIGNTTFNKDYRILWTEGRYDLTITRATYDRNNGRFICRVKEEGTGLDIHTSSTNLTVLIKPGSPQISPMHPIATQGRSISITCSSQGGSPDPEIMWYRVRDGLALQSVLKPGGGRDFPTTAVLTLKPDREDDEAEFMCEVRNRALTSNDKMAAIFRLNVNYYPIVRIEPSNPVRVIEGEDVQLTCQVDAKPVVKSVRWMRGDAFIQSTPRLTIKKASLNDAGRYICVADNNLGRPGEAEVTIDIQYPPAVSVVSRKVVNIGEDVLVSCNVSSNPQPNIIYWSKVGDPNFKQKREYLRLNRVTAANHGKYVCHAISILSPSSSEQVSVEGNATVRIRVRHAPGRSYILPSKPVAVDKGKIVLTCGANPPGYPETKYRWWRDNIPVIMGENYTIPIASQSHEGIYRCQPFNMMGNGTEVSVNLRVFQPPRILDGLKPTATYRRERTDLRLSCRAQGKPKPVAKWLKDKKEIKESDGLYSMDVTYTEIDRQQGFRVRSTLIFRGPERIGMKALRPEDRGRYECLFENEAKSVSSGQLLRVEHPPALAHQENKVAADPNENAKLICKMRAYPLPTFQWLHKGDVIESGRSGMRHQVNDTFLGDDMYVSILTVRGISERDYGAYTCKAVNDEGPSKTIIYLQRKGLPDPPKNLMIIDSGKDFLEIQFDRGFNGGFSNMSIFAIVSAPGKEWSVECPKQNVCSLVGLRQNTVHKIRFNARNPLGESHSSEPIIGRTAIDPKAIPAPKKVFVERGSGMVVFGSSEVNYDLVGRIEVMYADGTEWTKVPAEIQLQGTRGNYDLGPHTGGIDVRVQLCVVDSLDLCGPFEFAQQVNELPQQLVVAGEMQNVVAIIVGCVVAVAVLVLLAIVVFCCCCKQNRSTKLKNKTADLEVSHRGVVTQQAPPPPYYTVGLENKGMDASIDKGLDTDPSKTAIYGSQPYQSYGQNTHMPPPNNPNGIGGFMDNSYSNSNNGGSVNSQDSLWQVKGHQADPNQMNAQHMDPNADPRNTYNQYNPMVHGGYALAGYDDYAHYPQMNYQQGMPEEYPPAQHGNYNMPVSGDPYGVHGPRATDVVDNSYDVNGMPDPYLDNTSHHQGIPDMNSEHKPQLNFDESLESGFSTPNSRNRRIIREIIV